MLRFKQKCMLPRFGHKAYITFLVMLLVSQIAVVDLAAAYNDTAIYERRYTNELKTSESQVFFPELIDGKLLPNTKVNIGDVIRINLMTLGFKPSSTETYREIAGSNKYNWPYLWEANRLNLIEIMDSNPNFNDKKGLTTAKALELSLQIHGVPVPKFVDEEKFKELLPGQSAKGAFAPIMLRAYELGLLPQKNRRPISPMRRIDLIVTALGLVNFETKLNTNSTTKPSQQVITVAPIFNTDIVENPKFSILLDVWKKLTNDYVKKSGLDENQLLYGAIEGMVEKLGDQYSIFQEPAVSQAFNDSLSNEIQGIGASLGLDSQNNVIVISPIKGSPAEKAGILPGDIISKVDNKPLNNLSLAEVVRQIQGPAGTSVAVELKRGTRVFSLTITRTKLSVPVVTGEVTNDKILIMTINNFGVGTVEAFAQIANDAKSKNKLNGIIIDLRNNPGGFLTAAIDIAGYFLDKGKVVTKLVGPKVSETEYSNGPATLKGIPTYVLINKGSASAAEILAGALSANGAATLVGNQTFGKGTVQEVTSYSDNSALKLTVAEWLLPSGKSINKVGLSPDIKVDYTDADLKIGIDPQKLRALKALRGL